MPTNPTPEQGRDPDVHKGSIEDDHPDDPQSGGRNAPALDREGLPNDPTAIAQDRIGANVDDSEVSNADEAGQTSDAARPELDPLE